MIMYVSIIFSLIFSYLADFYKEKVKYVSYYFLFLVILILSLLSGLRLKYNDTARYIYNFNNFDNISINLSLGENPGFHYFQYFLKFYVWNNAHFFIFVTAFIINAMIILFYYKHSNKFSFVIYLYISSGFYFLGMSAIKQMLAISFGIWAIHYYFKQKYSIFFILITISMLFHAYAFMYLSVIFFNKKVWDYKTILLLFLSLLVGLSFNEFVKISINSLSYIKDYDINYILNQSSVNPFRVIFYLFVPILSFFFKEQINTLDNKFFILSINFSILSLIFLIFSLYGGAIMFGRVSSYFEPFIHISIIFLIYQIIPEHLRKIFIILIVNMYLFFFYYQFIAVKHFIYHPLNLEIF